MRRQKYSMNAKHVSLVVLVVQQVGVVLAIRYSRMRRSGEAYMVSTAVLVTEFFKLGINLLLEIQLVRTNKDKHLRKKKLSLVSELISRDAVNLAVPALLYVFQNVAEYVALTNLSVPLYQVTNQGKLLTTALFSRILLNKRLSTKQYGALIVLALGVAVVQLSSMDHEKLAGRQDKLASQNHIAGLLAVCFTCCTSGLAGVWFEMVLKQKGPTVSVYMRNSQLALWSIPLAVLPVLNDLDMIRRRGFFHGYDWLVFVVILSQAFYGLVVSLAMKYADTILKGFAVSISIVVGTIFTALIWEVRVDSLFVVGAAMVLYSTRLYAQNAPLPEKEKKGRPYRLPSRRRMIVLLAVLLSILLVGLLPTKSANRLRARARSTVKRLRKLRLQALNVRAAVEGARATCEERGRMLKHPTWETPILVRSEAAQQNKGVYSAQCTLRSIPADTEWRHPGYTGYAPCLAYTCNKDVEECDNLLPTNLDGPKPPCCVHLLRDMAVALDHAMCSLGLGYMVHWSSLLGLTRSDRFIPWTADHDITTTRAIIATMWSLRNEGTFSKLGLAVIHDSNMRVCIAPSFAGGKLLQWEKKRPWSNYLQQPEQYWFAHNSLYTDVSWTGLTEEDLYIGGGKSRFLPEDVYPLIRKPVYNGTIYLNFPHDPEAVLQVAYGPDWRTPDSDRSGHGHRNGYLPDANRSILLEHRNRVD